MTSISPGAFDLASKGSLLPGRLFKGNSMASFPIPSITGGAAGPSGAIGAPTGGNFTVTKGTNTFWLFMGAAVLTIGYVLVKKKK